MKSFVFHFIVAPLYKVKIYKKYLANNGNYLINNWKAK